ncbi:MAG TPA: hypothetical protein VI259_06970 [Gemmatimonadaceae bacterium]
MKSDASITNSVLVIAFIGVARVAKQKGAGGHHVATILRALLKSARKDDTDRMARVHLFEDAVAGAACAHHVSDGPSIASGEGLANGLSGHASDFTIANRGRGTGCNFCQDVGATVH